MRLAITGMGGEIGTGVARLLDREPGVSMMGLDMEPPRRRLVNAEFHRVAPEDVDRRSELIRDFDPEVMIHLGIYEPHSRSNPQAATARTHDSTRSVFSAAAQCPSLRKVVVRSGIEVYGRGRGAALRPDEDAACEPTSRFGHSLAAAEGVALRFGDDTGVPVTVLRFAPIVGPYIPSPLGRFLRLPAVPFAAPFDGPLQLVHLDDVHAAVVAAVYSDASGVFNIAGEGAVTGSQAARMGGRLIVPVIGPGWILARAVTAALGAPLPDHCLEALRCGRTADTARARDQLGFVARTSTRACVRDLYEWESIVRMVPDTRAAA